MATFTYETLSAADRVNIVREQLRPQEEAHYRATLASPEDGATAGRLKTMKAEIERLQAELKAAEAELAG